MTEKPPTDAQIRRRWINLGEFVALAGLTISGLALWNSWGGKDEADTAIVKQEAEPIPLALRGQVENDGRRLVIAPVESGHALDSLTVAANGKLVSVGSDGEISAVEVAALLTKDADESRNGQLTVTIDARYIERGQERRGGGRYALAYRWVDGGLFSGRSLRLTGFRRG